MKIHYFALIFALLANASANIMIKAGMRNLILDKGNLVGLLTQIMLNKLVVGGIILFGLNILSYAYVLNKMPLSQAYPIMTSIGFIVVVSGSVYFFGESINGLQISGMLLIVAGVSLIGSQM